MLDNACHACPTPGLTCRDCGEQMVSNGLSIPPCWRHRRADPVLELRLRHFTAPRRWPILSRFGLWIVGLVVMGFFTMALSFALDHF